MILLGEIHYLRRYYTAKYTCTCTNEALTSYTRGSNSQCTCTITYTTCTGLFRFAKLPISLGVIQRACAQGENKVPIVSTHVHVSSGGVMAVQVVTVTYKAPSTHNN